MAIILAGWFFPRLITQVTAIVLYPFHETVEWLNTSTESFPLYWRSRQQMIDRINDLEIRLATETGTQLSVRRLREENLILKSMLGEEDADGRILARVLSRPTVLPYDLMQIDKGRQSGVKEGAAVFLGYDTVIGLVVFTAQNYSLVELITSPDFTSSAYVLGPNIFLPLDGVGGGVARLRVPQGIDIPLGSPVILPGVSSGIVGEVVSVVGEPTQPEQYAFVAPPVSLNQLLYVSISETVFKVATKEEVETRIRDVLNSQFVIEELVEVENQPESNMETQ